MKNQVVVQAGSNVRLAQVMACKRAHTVGTSSGVVRVLEQRRSARIR